MKKQKTQKGITLIALIITIIVLLILAVVAINAVKNGGIIQHAQYATSSYKKADIKERAELVKAELMVDSKMDKSVILSKQAYIDRLEQEFSGTKQGNKVIVADNTYDIIVKNTNLDIEVKEHSDNIELDELVLFSDDNLLTNIDIEGKTQAVVFKPNIKAIMSPEEYQQMKESQVSDEQKKTAVLAYLSEEAGETITDLDQYTALYLNNADFGVSYDTIDEWFDEEKEGYSKLLESLEVESLTKEQLNALLYAEGSVESLTKDQAIEFYYEFIKINYVEDYDKNTKNVTVYYTKNGEILKQYVFHIGGGTGQEYVIEENGKYEFIIKNSDGDIVAFENFDINYIETEKSELYASVNKNTNWDISSGRLDKYKGTETSVIVPMYVGSQRVEIIGQDAFSGCNSIKEIIVPDSVSMIENRAFGYCLSLEKITLPNSITTIYTTAFEGCSKLTNIYFRAGNNPIPSGQPWGADSEVVVTKLTE